MSAGRLTDKQALFARHYLLTLNGTKAAIKAGFSKKSAGQIASEYLKKPNVQKAIREVMDDALAEHKLTLKGRIVQGYMNIAFGKKAANSDRVKALDALAKYENLWSDQAPNTFNFNLFSKDLISEGQ